MSFEEAQAEALLPEHPVDTYWPAALCLEMMAQCAALCRDIIDHTPSVTSGILIKATNLKLLTHALPQNTPMLITVTRLLPTDARLQQFKGTVKIHESECAEGQFMLISE